jgi:hypothetical protein
MSRIWDEKKRSNELIARDLSARSPVMQCLGCMDYGEECRTIVAFNTKTLVGNTSSIRREGPVVLGIRLHERFLSEAPHPMEIVTMLAPQAPYHPNCSSSGALCLGHPAAGISLELILHQVWAGLTFNMKFVNTRAGQIVNGEAAAYVRANAHRLPITKRGLFEEPEDELRNGDWHVLFEPQIHAASMKPFFEAAHGVTQ